MYKIIKKRLLTSLAICKNPITICLANDSLSPQHNRPNVYSDLSFTFDGSFAFPTILNRRSATVNFVTSSVESKFVSLLFTLKGFSASKEADCFSEALGRGSPEQRARSETAEHDVLTNNVCGLMRKLAEKVLIG